MRSGTRVIAVYTRLRIGFRWKAIYTAYKSFIRFCMGIEMVRRENSWRVKMQTIPEIPEILSCRGMRIYSRKLKLTAFAQIFPCVKRKKKSTVLAAVRRSDNSSAGANLQILQV